MIKTLNMKTILQLLVTLSIPERILCIIKRVKMHFIQFSYNVYVNCAMHIFVSVASRFMWCLYNSLYHLCYYMRNSILFKTKMVFVLLLFSLHIIFNAINCITAPTIMYYYSSSSSSKNGT